MVGDPSWKPLGTPVRPTPHLYKQWAWGKTFIMHSRTIHKKQKSHDVDSQTAPPLQSRSGSVLYKAQSFSVSIFSIIPHDCTITTIKYSLCYKPFINFSATTKVVTRSTKVRWTAIAWVCDPWFHFFCASCQLYMFLLLYCFIFVLFFHSSSFLLSYLTPSIIAWVLRSCLVYYLLYFPFWSIIIGFVCMCLLHFNM